MAEDGHTTEYSLEDVAILRLDLPQFCLRLAAALDLSPESGADDHIVDAYLVATIDRQGIPLPVYLVLTPDDDRFGAAALRIAAASRQHPSLILSPTPRRGSDLRRLGGGAGGVTLLALNELFAFTGPGLIVPVKPVAPVLASAIAYAAGDQPATDGVVDRHRIVFRGAPHECRLKEREFEFLKRTWGRSEIRVDEMINKPDGLIAKRRFGDTKRARNSISSFLKGLNKNLLESEPPLPINYSLPKGSDVVVREVYG